MDQRMAQFLLDICSVSLNHFDFSVRVLTKISRSPAKGAAYSMVQHARGASWKEKKNSQEISGYCKIDVSHFLLLEWICAQRVIPRLVLALVRR